MTRSRDPRVAAPRSFLLRTSSPQQTEALGRALGALLRAGDVVALSGDLGAGKTILTRGIAAGAGATGHIASPTFTLIREYRGPVTIFHADLYRLEEPAQFEDIGLEEALDSGGIVVIEWAEKAGPLLPAEYLWAELRFTEQDTSREIEFIPRGSRFAGIAGRLVSMPR
ncbi:MAG: tRNA (adenosine(37)-N6)-threonylcarbamoyltransferase complex ATPase subunit type 1 TsaE [bacterium]